jgi:hypothetical protein
VPKRKKIKKTRLENIMKTRTAYRGVAILGASILLIANTSAVVPTNPAVYRNANEANNTGLFRDVTDTRGLAAGTTITAVGDEITLGGTGRALTDLQFNYFLSAASGNETAQVSLFANTGVNGSPAATAFYTSDIQTAIPAGQHRIDVNGISGFILPNSFTFAITFGGIDGAETAGPMFYSGPAGAGDIGSSLDDHWVNTNNGWQLLDFPGVTDNFGLAVYAVPEPSTWALMLSGLGMLGYFGYRRKQ